MVQEKKTSLPFKIIKGLVKLFYPKFTVEGQESLPDEPTIIVGNHSKMNGPIACELYFPGHHYTWCAGQMMQVKEVPDYAFQDFWSNKPKYIRWFYRLASYVIAPFSAWVFQNANAIGVYHDVKIISTFKETVRVLQDGASVIIFPEQYTPYNHIVCQFQQRFVDTARYYYRKTGKELCFVPLYIAPALKKMFIGKPIRFCSSNSIEEECARICNYLMEEITQIACSLPEHTVVPYPNIPKKNYPSNIPPKVSAK